MSTETLWPWITLLVLGAVHGINPGMGWLFAVALGLQEKKSGAVWRALPPLVLGHAVAIAAALGVAALIGLVVPLQALRWCVAAVLLVFGLRRLFRHGHPRWGGMRVGPRDLAIWSFLMASAHGAGLMVLPLVVGRRAAALVGGLDAAAPHAGHAAHAGASAAGGLAPALAGLSAEYTTALAVTAVHTLGYLLVTGVVAVLVYEKLGLRLLRTAWINLDVIWAAALIATALVTPLL